MIQAEIDRHYLLLKNWWESVDLTTYEKKHLNKEIISFNQQLFRLKEKKIRIGFYGKAGVGKSSILNSLFNQKKFKTGVINGSTKKIEINEWPFNHKILKTIELLDSPGFDFCNVENPKNIFTQIYNSELIYFIITGDINRNELSEIDFFIKNGKKIIIILNKIDIWSDLEIKKILENIKSKLPENLNIPIFLNTQNNIKSHLIDTLNKYGENLLILNSLQLADKLFLKIKEQRLKRRQKEAQTIIGKFATIKASGVALNPLILLDIAGSFALDTALINELSKVYGLTIKGESAKNIIKKISLNNILLGATQVGVNTSFNVIRKIILATAPFTNGLSLLPYGPISIIQAAIAVRSTRTLGKLAAKEIFHRSKVCSIDPSLIIQRIIIKEPEIFNYTKIYLSNRLLENNFVIFLP